MSFGYLKYFWLIAMYCGQDCIESFHFCGSGCDGQLVLPPFVVFALCPVAVAAIHHWNWWYLGPVSLLLLDFLFIYYFLERGQWGKVNVGLRRHFHGGMHRPVQVRWWHTAIRYQDEIHRPILEVALFRSSLMPRSGSGRRYPRTPWFIS